MRKPSKGPWSTGPLGDFNKVYDSDDMLICQTYQTDELSYVNARFIAAAPAMYEALEHAAMSCHHPACKCKGEYASQPERYCTCHVQKARQALAQAEGRQA